MSAARSATAAPGAPPGLEADAATAALGDVVVAAATPWGVGALAVLRVSGPGTRALLARWVRPRRGGPWRAGRARRVDVLAADGAVLDDGVLIFQESPRSYTGEDAAELTIHGNPLLVDLALDAALRAGARLAGPGEFTRRALLNGKIDAVEAEAVLHLAEATSRRGVAIARDGLDGPLRAFYAELRESLAVCGAELEARLDWPGDELAIEPDDALVARLRQVAADADALASTYDAGKVLVRGARVALVGAVNAGKSSLFNALVGAPRALVHATAGTTRDVLELPTTIDGLSVTLLDTAGERPTDDPVEAAGQALAASLIAEADLLVIVLRARATGPDAAESAILARTADRRRVIVVNAIDAPLGADAPAPLPPGGANPGDEAPRAVPTSASEGDLLVVRGARVPSGALVLSAKTAEGIPALRAALRATLVGEAGQGGLVLASARQRDRLLAVAASAREAAAVLGFAGPVVASELVTEALVALGEITGGEAREAVLSALFARFCVGK